MSRTRKGATCMKAIVLNSGGVDSTTCVGIAVDRYGKENVTTVSAYYGQKNDKELSCAEKIAERYGVAHRMIDLASTHIMDGSDCTLLQGGKDIAHGTYAEQMAERDGKVATYVPFRNGLLLAAVAAVAQSVYPHEECELYIGAHADDAAGDAYPDRSPEFMKAMGKAIELGSYGLVHLKAPFVNLDKAGVVAWGLKLHVPYELTWSCYEGGNVQCGVCGTCLDRKKAFAANGVADPVPCRQ